ncbi:3-deoxy-manno-octulosonate cytidylyltransferase [Rhizobium sp. ARZ01]|uniref:3-deoxy-manno-octulosonate cytidylyltransferase n=1 Tax=Rhizobium sp. ARZ01 TaxID=2769313 RepID=UPI00177BE2DB|nr:3-deoxy-manno-octulosonate cytidylyltransferase [Rhizobium sp. ARZ01]MBD9375321.1 3-deoxy-manno-octulosonate cytidylyltransferase [Rhizobium sp. ARZ01]
MGTPRNAADAGLPPPGSTSGLTRPEDWRQIFSAYSHIVLVANSTAVDVGALRALYPATTLYVFFNRVIKVLDRPFEGHALLVCRGQPNGANIVYRGEVGEILSYFEKATFLGIMNIRLNVEERLNSAADFKNAPTGHLDFVGHFDDFYTAGKTPTSGFAIALWLSELGLQSKITLAGFSARRTEKWRVVSAHDWSFEQVFIRLFARLGKIDIQGGVGANAYAALTKRFPEIPPAEIALAASEVLSERLSNTDAEVDKLISLTNFIRAADELLRRLKPSILKRQRPGSS